MKILHSWLQDFIETPLTVEDLSAKLTRLGFNIEETKKTGAAFSGVVTAQILKIEKHPNADKLSLCELNDGTGTQKVVCGAKNIAEGQKILLAKVGAGLPGGVLKKAKIRGIESEGMICSAAELGLEGYDNSGIIVMPESTVPGTDAATLFSKPDCVLEVEITPNLGYCLSHYALARELCIFYNLPFKKPALPELPLSSGPVPVEIEAPGLCRRYIGVVLEQVSPAKTPAWMANRLRAMGSSPKDNILIDASNYVTYELGQPTHCFDLEKLAGQMVKAREAVAGETLKALDGRDLKLEAGMLVIADKEKPAALAGVIGGFDSAVSESTNSVIIESAVFNPSVVRASSKKTATKTESSYRFERGTDPELALLAARRMAQLIQAVIPGAKIKQVTDLYPSKAAAKVIEVNPERINAILGTELAEKEIFTCLKAIQPELSEAKPWKFEAPSYRQDIDSVWDIAEEVARFVGYEVIPAVSKMPMMRAVAAPSYEVVSALKQKLSGLGFSEVYNYDFVSVKDLKNSFMEEAQSVPLKNPLSVDYQFMRQTLISGLLKTLKYNINRGKNSVSIFEIGSVYRKTETRHSEEVVCAGLISGAYPAHDYWRQAGAKADFYHLKGVIASLFENQRGFRFEKPHKLPAYFHPAEALEMRLGNFSAGCFGLLHPSVAANCDFKDPDIYYFELPLKALVSSYKPEFWQRLNKMQAVSSYPGVSRDISVVLESKFAWEDIVKEISKVSGLSSIALIDVYKGKNIDPNFRSLTIRLSFSSMEKTLTDAEVNAGVTAALDRLTVAFSAKLRS